MNNTLAKRSLLLPQTVCDVFEERAVDMDIVLPDYIPEVSAVLTCHMRPYVTSRTQSGDRFTVDGTVAVRVKYTADDRQTIQCYEASQPFHVSFACDRAVHHMVSLKTDYVNCRAVAPRRIDVHGAFRVFLKAFGTDELSVFAPTDDRRIFCKTKMIEGMIPIAESEKSFILEERIDLGTSIDRLICADAVVVSSEIKQLLNKVIVKGVLRLKVLFQQDSHTKSIIQEVPFSQILDVDGMCEDWISALEATVGDCDVHLQTGENGLCFVMMSTKLSLYLCCYTAHNEEIVLDAYSIDHPLLCETASAHFSLKTSDYKDRLTIQSQTDLPDQVQGVEDVWGELKKVEIVSEDHGKCVSLCILLGMIGRDQNGNLAYYERTLDLTAPYNSNGSSCQLKLIGCESHVNGSVLRLQFEAELVEHSEKTNVEILVCDAVEDVNNPFEKPDAAIRIVYAHPGTTVWNIAKTHHACVNDILTENEMTDPVITAPTMLMIPMM